MCKTAIVFSGQGAQAPGMGNELFDTYKSAKDIFNRAEALRPGTIRQCFEGSKEELTQTINTQPCLFTVDVAAGFALKETGVMADGVAGFSLGELAGVVYSGMLSFEEGFKLVCKRAEIMDEASKSGGCMAAVLKTECSVIEKLCSEIGGVYPVNYNCEGQTVVAGSENEIAVLTQKISIIGGRVIKLPVSGAFHSPYMQKAYESFKSVTNALDFKKPKIDLYSNVTAKPYGQNISELLSLQLKSPVLWQKTIENMINEGFDTFIEAGTGNTLAGLIKRINPNVNIFSAINKEGINAVLAAKN